MLYKVLEKMRAKPGLFPCESVRDIFIFIQGFHEGLGANFNSADFEDFKNFQDFVIKYYGNNATHPNWATLINFYSSSGRDSFDNFFILLDKFKNR